MRLWRKTSQEKMAHPNQWYVPNDGECKELELVLHHRGLIYCQ